MQVEEAEVGGGMITTLGASVGETFVDSSRKQWEGLIEKTRRAIGKQDLEGERTWRERGPGGGGGGRGAGGAGSCI